MRVALAPFRLREFRLLFAGELVSLLGTAVAPVALAFAVLDLTGSATDLGYVLAAGWLPQIVFILVGGVLGDRLPRNLVMVGANLLSAAAQGAAAGLLLAGLAHPWQLAVLQAVSGTATALFFPAAQAVLPEIVETELLQPANALVRLAQNGSTVLGAGLGGLAVAAAGPGWAIAFDAATYLISGLIVLQMRIPRSVVERGETIVRELIEGWNEFRSREWLWVIVVCASVGNLAATASFNVLGPLIAKRYLGGAPAYGAIVASQSAGFIAGGLLSLRWRPARPLLVSLVALLPALGEIACYAGVRVTAAIVTVAFFAGVGLETFGVNWITALQQHVPSRVLSRVNSYDALGSFIFIPLGLVIAGPLAARFGVTEALWFFLALAGASIAAALLSRDVRTLRRVEPAGYTEAEARSAAAS
ncbi:MAG TPA: MFS transporter [Gaiellaceae bacterium]|jgi:MFS family permease|nr:MFS transporter [Gaiellaceae bacterium]